MTLSKKTRLVLGMTALLVAAGFLLRGLFPGRIAVEHFDEGVYASNLVAGESYRFAYPSRHLFAPPLLPGIIEWLQVGLGVGDFSATAANLLAGGLTVLLAGFVAGRWWGTAAGLAAAALSALSGIHILYSRTALTDPLLCFWLLAAVYAIWRSLADGDKSWAVVAGVLTGLAWWTKYNGWLPLAIGTAAAIPWLAALRDRRRLLPTITCLLIMIGTAVLVWAPVWRQLPDGYAPVAANHRQYVVGPAGWFGSLWRQLLNHRLLDGYSGGLSLFVATAVAGTAQGKRPSLKIFVLAAGLWGLATLSTSSVVLAAVGCYWLWRHVRIRPAASPATDEEAARQLSIWLLVAWMAGLTLTTPLYTPYPRITLPWLVAVWLAGGAGIAWFVSRIAGQSAPLSQTSPAARSKSPFLMWVLLAGGLLAAMLPWAWSSRTGMVAWQDRKGMAHVAAAVNADIQQRLHDRGVPRGADFVVDVYGEPSLYFQLRSIGVDLALPVSSLRFAQPDAPPPSYPTFLISGPHAEGAPRFAAQFQTAQPRLKLIGTYEYAPSDFVRLNDASPPEIHVKNGRSGIFELRLYEVQ